MGRYLELLDRLVAKMEKTGYALSPDEVRDKPPSADLTRNDGGLNAYPPNSDKSFNNNGLSAAVDLTALNAYFRPPVQGVKEYKKNKKHNNINSNSKIVFHPDGAESQEVRGLRGKFKNTPFDGAFQAFVNSDRNKALNHRYVQAVVDARQFLADFGSQAESLGWRSEELFGLDEVAPLARYDRMGLVWMIDGNQVVAITATSAVIRVRESGSELRFYRRPLIGSGVI